MKMPIKLLFFSLFSIWAFFQLSKSAANETENSQGRGKAIESISPAARVDALFVSPTASILEANPTATDIVTSVADNSLAASIAVKNARMILDHAGIMSKKGKSDYLSEVKKAQNILKAPGLGEQNYPWIHNTLGLSYILEAEFKSSQKKDLISLAILEFKLESLVNDSAAVLMNLSIGYRLLAELTEKDLDKKFGNFEKNWWDLYTIFVSATNYYELSLDILNRTKTCPDFSLHKKRISQLEILCKKETREFKKDAPAVWIEKNSASNPRNFDAEGGCLVRISSACCPELWLDLGISKKGENFPLVFRAVQDGRSRMFRLRKTENAQVYIVDSISAIGNTLDFFGGDCSDRENLNQTYQVSLRPKNDSEAQRWRIVPTAEGPDEYWIEAEKCPELRLDVFGGECVEEPTRIGLVQKNNGCAQRWKIVF